MIKTLYILGAVICLQSFFVLKTSEKKLMYIKLDKSSYFLGEPVPIKVCFKNSSKETMVLENPKTSADVLVHFIDASDSHDYFYPMQKIEVLFTDRKTDQYVTIEPPKEQISIPPSSSFEFITDANERLYLQAGVYSCFVSNNNLQSNKVDVKITFNDLSVDHFFKIVQNKDIEYSRRDWAMKEIQKIHPEFRPNLSREGDAEDIKTKKEAENIPVYHEFAEWWKKNKDKWNH